MFFNGGVNTGCGGATSDTGPFYCPADKRVYIDLSFYKELEQRFGAQGGNLSRAYVIAHEYGHHVQDLLGTTNRVQAGDSGPTSGSVRLELQADCYAGVWTNHAANVPTSSGQPLIEDITPAGHRERARHRVAHRRRLHPVEPRQRPRQLRRSSPTARPQQREKWFTTGYQTGDPAQCDTFARGVNLG